MTKLPAHAIPLVKSIVDRLQQGQLRELLGDPQIVSFLTESEIAGVVADYPGNLVPIPDAELAELSGIDLDDAPSHTWHVPIWLWTDLEGRSDLVMSLRLVEIAPSVFNAEIEWIRVP